MTLCMCSLLQSLWGFLQCHDSLYVFLAAEFWVFQQGHDSVYVFPAAEFLGISAAPRQCVIVCVPCCRVCGYFSRAVTVCMCSLLQSLWGFQLDCDSVFPVVEIWEFQQGRDSVHVFPAPEFMGISAGP